MRPCGSSGSRLQIHAHEASLWILWNRHCRAHFRRLAEWTFTDLTASTEYKVRVTISLQGSSDYARSTEVLPITTLDAGTDALRRCDNLEENFEKISQSVESVKDDVNEVRERLTNKAVEHQAKTVDNPPAQPEEAAKGQDDKEKQTGPHTSDRDWQPKSNLRVLSMSLFILLPVLTALPWMTTTVTVSSLQRPLNRPPLWLNAGERGTVFAEVEEDHMVCGQQLVAATGTKGSSVPICPHLTSGFAINLNEPASRLQVTRQGSPSSLRGTEFGTAFIQDGDSNLALSLGDLYATRDGQLLVTDTTEDGGVLSWMNGSWINLGSLNVAVYSLCLSGNYIYAGGRGIHRWDATNGWKEVSAGIDSKGRIRHMASWKGAVVATVFSLSDSKKPNPSSEFTTSDVYVWDKEAAEWIPHYAGQYTAGGILSMLEDTRGRLAISGVDFENENMGKISIFDDVTDHKPTEFFSYNEDGTPSSVTGLIDVDGTLHACGSFTKLTDAYGAHTWMAAGAAFLKYDDHGLPQWHAMSKYSLGNIKQLFEFQGQVFALGRFASAHCRQGAKCIARWNQNSWHVVAKHDKEIKDVAVVHTEAVERLFAYTDGSVDLLNAHFEWEPLESEFDSWIDASKDRRGVSDYGLNVGRTNILGKKQDTLHSTSSLVRFTIRDMGEADRQIYEKEADVEVLEEDNDFPIGGAFPVLGRSGKFCCGQEQTRELVRKRSDGEVDTLCLYDKYSYEDLKDSCWGNVPLGVPIVSNSSWPVLLQYKDASGELQWTELASTPSHLGLVYYKGSEFVKQRSRDVSVSYLVVQTIFNAVLMVTLAVLWLDPELPHRLKSLVAAMRNFGQDIVHYPQDT
eukprot:gb/GECG01005940.1/.p1 GENE.gb/GECG01005940.1/~~gb/GECG01005940.1/.p1  ORF type:complete len:852 (+),score=103.48 gb/GECG01005940.1/:1-2556(+)